MARNQNCPLKSKLFKSLLVLLLVALAGWGQILAANAAAPESTLILLLGVPQSVQPVISAAGGHVIHLFPDAGLIATLPATAVDPVSATPGVVAAFTQAVDPALLDVYGPQARQLGLVWNSLLAPPPATVDDLFTAQHAEEHHDLFIAPDLPTVDDLFPANISVRPGYYQTSDFMAGSVAVGIVLVESDGSIDPSTENWTSDEKQHVFSEIVNATNWWAQLDSRANLTFVYDDHFTNPLPTNVEPIKRPAFDYYDSSYDQSKWIGDAMGALGYTASSYFARVRDYNNNLREIYQTDWAFTIFVVDSSGDPDNRFTDGYFAYAYLGGPFMVMTYGNNGYGPGYIDAVAAHEMGHIFNALDQYYSAHQGCTDRSGYLYVENQNSQYGSCSSNTSSIMRGQISPYTAKALDSYAAGQIGWRDSDGDDILDPLDTDLPVNIESATVISNSLTVRGAAGITPYVSPTKTDVTINSLTGVQYRIDSGSWQVASLAGDFGDVLSNFEFTVDGLPAGQHTLAVAAVDSAGNVSQNVASTQFTIEESLPAVDDGGLNTELNNSTTRIQAGQAITITGLSYHTHVGRIITGVEYRFNDSAWQPATPQDGAFNSNYEPFIIDLNILSQEQTSILLEARAGDDTGYWEQDVAKQEVELNISQPHDYTVFIPIVLGGK